MAREFRLRAKTLKGGTSSFRRGRGSQDTIPPLPEGPWLAGDHAADCNDREDWEERVHRGAAPVAGPGDGIRGRSAVAYNVVGVPKNYPVDSRSGKIVAKNLRKHRLDRGWRNCSASRASGSSRVAEGRQRATVSVALYRGMRQAVARSRSHCGVP